VRDNIFFKAARFTQGVTLRLAPFAAAVLTLRGDTRAAVGMLVVWAMVVTAMLTIKEPTAKGGGQ